MEISVLIKKDIISFILNEINDKVLLAFDEETGGVMVDYFEEIKSKRIERIKNHVLMYIHIDDTRSYMYNRFTELSYKSGYCINFTYVNSFNIKECLDIFVEDIYKLLSYMRDDMNKKDYRNLIFEVFMKIH